MKYLIHYAILPFFRLILAVIFIAFQVTVYLISGILYTIWNFKYGNFFPYDEVFIYQSNYENPREPKIIEYKNGLYWALKINGIEKPNPYYWNATKVISDSTNSAKVINMKLERNIEKKKENNFTNFIKKENKNI